jgi:hypothetical protein
MFVTFVFRERETESLSRKSKHFEAIQLEVWNITVEITEGGPPVSQNSLHTSNVRSVISKGALHSYMLPEHVYPSVQKYQTNPLFHHTVTKLMTQLSQVYTPSSVSMAEKSSLLLLWLSCLWCNLVVISELPFGVLTHWSKQVDIAGYREGIPNEIAAADALWNWLHGDQHCCGDEFLCV